MIRTKVIVGVFLVYFTMVFSSSVNASVELSMDEGKAMMNSKKINEALQKAGKSKVVAEKSGDIAKRYFSACADGGGSARRNVAWCWFKCDANFKGVAE
ncbi:hypothetical protein [Listeria rocourtiae]|uniref:hypothetical protein n=1 Tax=Listeria rocourtiae TaxID=647910 RepID=UPI0003E8B34D|nr:hypothetical protein [Listeria rocourtiae]EUJ47565.1 hypothetical protein PROCOU_08282 [Listeria rocourtiae FSL F6-920]